MVEDVYIAEVEEIVHIISRKLKIPVRAIYGVSEVLAKSLPKGLYSMVWMDETLPPVKYSELIEWIEENKEKLKECDYIAINFDTGQMFCFEKTR